MRRTQFAAIFIALIASASAQRGPAPGPSLYPPPVVTGQGVTVTPSGALAQTPIAQTVTPPVSATPPRLSTSPPAQAPGGLPTIPSVSSTNPATPPVFGRPASAPAGSLASSSGGIVTGTPGTPTTGATPPTRAPLGSPPTQVPSGSPPTQVPSGSPPTQVPSGGLPVTGRPAQSPSGGVTSVPAGAPPTISRPAQSPSGVILGTPAGAPPATGRPAQSPSGIIVGTPGGASPTTGRPAQSPTGTTVGTPPVPAPPVEAPATPRPSGAVVPSTGGVIPARAPIVGPAVAPSSSGYYNATVQASNATGTLSGDQASEFSQQIQNLFSNNGVNTGVDVTGQSVASGTASTGRRLSQSTFSLNINIVFGPVSPQQAALCRSLLDGLNINLGGVVVIVVIVFVPVTVYVPSPPAIVQPPSVPTLPPSAPISVPPTVAPAAPGTGGNLQSQNVAGGGIVTQQGVGNQQVVNNNSGNTVTNNVVNNIDNSTTINNNSIVNNVVNNVQNPTTPGSQTPAAPTSPTSPGTETPAAPTTPAAPGGASADTATTTETPPTYITQPAPTGSVPPAPPSPPPSPPPACGTQPQCRIYTRDMLCCQNEGILTPFQGAQVEILCTHPVRFAITCLATSGPTNISAASVYNNDYGFNYNFRTNINWLGQLNGYLGKVAVDVEPARQDASRQECSLNLQTPCTQDGELVTTMPPVQPLAFSVIDFNSFYQNYVGFPPTNAIGQFSYSWMGGDYPGGCLEQPTLTVPGSFFLGSWPTQEGFAYPCNASITYNAVQQSCPSQTTQYSSGVAGIAP